MKLKYMCIAGVILGAMILSVVGVAAEATSHDETCVDVEFVWMRGSGQPYGQGKERDAYGEQIAARMAAERIAARYKFYEVDYPAIDIDLEVAGEAFISAGTGEEYGKSVEIGIANLVAHVRGQAEKCPEQKFVLSGYSQSANVVGESLFELTDYIPKVIYVNLIGDPKAYLPEAFSVWPALPETCDGKGTLSDYRIWAPDCKTYQGTLLGRRPYVPIGWEGKVGLYCNDNDFVCGSGEHPLDISGHLSYDETMPIIAEKTVEMVAQQYPRKMSLEKAAEMQLWALQQLPMETVFMIDSSESMRGKTEKLRGKIVELAELILANGGRVALVEYRGVMDENYPKLLCDFSCTDTEFFYNLGQIRADGAINTTRTLRDGHMLAYEQLDWGDETAKSIVVLTDDWGGGRVGFEEMLEKSYSLGGVSTYIATWRSTIDNEQLASRTGGKIFTLGGNAEQLTRSFEKLMDTLVGRPVIRLGQDTLCPAIGEEVWIDTEISYGVGAEIRGFDWDIHADGAKEREMGDPEVSWIWWREVEEYVVAWANDSVGRSSIATAKIRAGGVAPCDDVRDDDTDNGDSEEEDAAAEDNEAVVTPIEEKWYGINTTEWIEESKALQDAEEDMNPISSFLYGQAEDMLEGILGTDLSVRLGKEPKPEVKMEEGVDVELVEAGKPQKKQGWFGWVVGGVTLLVTGAGAVYEIVAKRR